MDFALSMLAGVRREMGSRCCFVCVWVLSKAERLVEGC